MKEKYRKSIALLLIALLILPMLSACSAYDKDYAIYELWVAGVKVTTRNQGDILGDGTVSYKGDGNSGTLTLNGANIVECLDPNAEAMIVSTIKHITLELVGENELGMGEKAPVNGVSAYNLTIKGEGSLAVGARASCIKADTFTVESGKIDTYIKTAEDEVASFLGIGFWAQDLLTINGGDIAVHYLPAFAPLSYGIYCVKDVIVNGGSITIKQEEAEALAVGLIASEKLTIAGGNVSVYGNDDAMNAKYFAMTDGTVNVSAVDMFIAGFDPETGNFAFGSDGVCRLVYQAEISGGSLTLAALQRVNPQIPTFFSVNLSLDGMTVKGGETADTLVEQDVSNYTYTDTCIRIEKEEN